MNTYYLNDQDYKVKINAAIQEITLEYQDVKQRWEMIKMKVRSVSIQFCAREAKSQRNQLAALEKKLILLETKLAKNESLFNDYNQQIALVKSDIEQIYMHRANGAKLRCQANWIEGDEKCIKYFTSLEKCKTNRRAIDRLKNDANVIVSNPEEIARMQVNLYKKLYTTTGRILPVEYLEGHKYHK